MYFMHGIYFDSVDAWILKLLRYRVELLVGKYKQNRLNRCAEFTLLDKLVYALVMQGHF